jgi:prevent-host-death family protein
MYLGAVTHNPTPSADVSARQLRSNLAEHLNAVAVRGQIVYVTNRGRRIAALVPVHIAEGAEGDPDDDGRAPIA